MQIARQSTRGGVVLFSGNLLWTVISLVGLIFVQRLLGPVDYGLYLLITITASLLQLFAGLGVNIAATRFVAYHVARGETEIAIRFAKNAILFTLLTGLVLSVFCFFAAGPISNLLLHRPAVERYIELVSIMEAGQALLQATIGVSVGLGAMGLASVFNVSQSVFRSIISPVLLLVGLGLGGAVIGFSTSFVFSGVLAIGILYAMDLRPRSQSLRSFSADVAEMIRYGLPAFFATLLSGIGNYYVPLVLAAFASDATIGYYGIATGASAPITILSASTGTALFAAFANLQGVSGDLAGAFARATKYVAYVTMPVIFFLAVAARPLIALIPGIQYLPGTDYVVYLALAYSPILLGMSVISSYFNGIGQTRITLYSVGIATASLFVLAPLLTATTSLGVVGSIFAIFLSNAILVVVGLYVFHRQSGRTVEGRPAAAILATCLISYVTAFILPLTSSYLFDLVAKIVVFGAVYLTLGPALGSVGADDLGLIHRSLTGMRAVGRIVDPFMRYQTWVAESTHPKSKPQSEVRRPTA